MEVSPTGDGFDPVAAFLTEVKQIFDAEHPRASPSPKGLSHEDLCELLDLQSCVKEILSGTEPGFDFKRSEPERAPTTSCSPVENVDICLQIELQGSHVAKVDLVDAGVTPSPDKPNACDHFLDDSFYVSVQKDEDSEEGLSCHFETAQELLQETVDQPVTPDLSTGSPEKSAISCSSMMSMASDVIRKEMLLYGDTSIGPITPTTRRTYLIRLKKLRCRLIKPATVCVANFEVNSLKKLGAFSKIDNAMCEQFNAVVEKVQFCLSDVTREGLARTSFNYLLLDPRETQNLPSQHLTLGESNSWNIFLRSIFYVGKGTRSRPFHHLYEAAKKADLAKSNPNTRMGRLSEKTKRILDIWENGFGVISLQVFQNSLGVEAYTREAAMIEALGLSRLTNERSGDYYSVAKTWSTEKRICLGFALIYRCFKIFLYEGERQLKLSDLRCRRN